MGVLGIDLAPERLHKAPQGAADVSHNRVLQRPHTRGNYMPKRGRWGDYRCGAGVAYDRPNREATQALGVP